jgi:hypothetical protein
MKQNKKEQEKKKIQIDNLICLFYCITKMKKVRIE